MIASLFILLVCLAIVFADDVLLQPLASTMSGTESCVLFIQGADITPEQYTPLMTALQESSDLKLYIGIPQYAHDYAVYDLGKGMDRVQAKLVELGMSADTRCFVAGHSLGGAMLQMWSHDNPTTPVAQMLLGSFITRAFKNSDYQFDYNVPTLTIGGELDGQCRVTRIAECFYTQLIDETAVPTSVSDFPVLVEIGVSHMQFASGDPPSLVQKHDLLPEVTEEEAHKMIAEDMAAFMSVRLSNDADALSYLTSRVEATQEFITPIITSLKLEGYHNFRPPCLCDTDVCPPEDYCTNNAPFTNEYSQPTMGSDSGLDGVTITINNTDSQHDVWETQPTVHLPKILNSCDATDNCILNTQTITQVAYHTGEDMEVWKIHFNNTVMDTGFEPLSAFEMKTKMSSRQHIYTAAGIANVSFDAVDGGDVRCGEINQASIDWAIANVGASTLARYQKYGQLYSIGSDINVCSAGPCWIWKELEYKTINDDSVVVSSPQFSTAMDFLIPKSAGFHYCKVLSPARVTEWIYVDSLRAKYSLNSQK